MTEALTNTATPLPATKIPDLNFKEIVTAAIALAIVTTMIVFLWQGFNAKTLEENQKYIIGIVLSLAGTVTGYYFGRVPACRVDPAGRVTDRAGRRSRLRGPRTASADRPGWSSTPCAAG
jgi:hypothetical protein